MVVAQIPLWIIHGTTPSGVGVVNGAASGSGTGPLSSSQSNRDDNNTNNSTNNPDKTTQVLFQNGRNQLNMWNIGGGGKTTTTTTTTSSSEKRSAIYCCDVSLERIATGGGDGKIRIWNLNSLFHTSKTDPTYTSKTKDKKTKTKTIDDSSNPDGNEHGATATAADATAAATSNDEDVDMKKQKVMGKFRRGGGYVSSDDSSECESRSSVENNDGSPPVTRGENGSGDEGEEGEGGGGGNEVTPMTNGEHQRPQEQTVEKINDITSLIKRKNQDNNETTTTSIDAKTGKKRKRAELIQGVERPPPQSLKSTQSTSSSTPGKKTSETTTSHKSIQKYDQKQRLLCTLASHSGSVLTLRFSTSGTYLASAGDDAHVLLYTKTNTPSILTTGNLLSSDGGSGTREDNDNVEHWERIRILRGHNLDVVGLAWAPDDSHLVSCSLDSDSPICVWRLNLDNDYGNNDHNHIGGSYDSYKHNHQKSQCRSSYGGNSSGSSGSILHPYKVLGKNEHTSTVKGVAFDPAGKYMASSGDDPAICIWRAFDDWGLEAKVDSSSGVFRSKKKGGDDGGNNTNGESGDNGEEDMQALANLSLFRRISFAPDGTHICGTNATLRGKNIAAMISRNGWGVSVPKKGQSSSTAGAANLVGHKQPVVSSRHCPYFFEVDSQTEGMSVDNDDDDLEPQYSTLVALGDKKGFVSIWSTKKSRPIFKLQCSETKCTVTDISWGLLPSSQKDSIIMLVSLLDGLMVALKFDLPRELGRLLSREKKHKIFRLKYGIELGSVGSSGRRLVDDKSGPKLIENVLQYEMEEEDDKDEDEEDNTNFEDSVENENMDVDQDEETPMRQVESQTPNGKKRIQPVLLNESNRLNGKATSSSSPHKDKVGSVQKSKTKQNIDGVMNALEKAASTAEGISNKNSRQSNIDNNENSISTNISNGQPSTASNQRPQNVAPGVGFQSIQYVVPPKSNQKTYTINLSVSKADCSVLEAMHDHSSSSKSVSVTATCTNSTQSPPGIGRGVPCATLSIIRDGARTWRDHILGTTCTSFASCSSLMAVGTFDGTIYLYGTSPSSGWESGISFRSHAPIVMTSSIVRLCLTEREGDLSNPSSHVEIVVLTSDGNFGVYSILPNLKVLYKGNVIGPMNQMSLSMTNQALANNNKAFLPEVARIFSTQTGDLVLVLSCSKNAKGNIGGMIQGFVYNRSLETWLRISDDRFVYSNFYSSVPSSKLSTGLLSSLDETVKGCKSGNTSNRRRSMETSAAAMYYLNEDDEYSLQSFVTRAHCEDRLACAIVMQSKDDFKKWFSLYVRRLCLEVDSDQLRFVIDLLLNESNPLQNHDQLSCWWLSPGSDILGLSKKEIVEQLVIPELSKNRSLQRLLNEIATELNSM